MVTKDAVASSATDCNTFDGKYYYIHEEEQSVTDQNFKWLHIRPPTLFIKLARA